MKDKLNCILLVDDDEPTNYLNRLAIEKSGCTERDVLADLNAAVLEARANVTFAELPTMFAYRTEMKQLFQNLVIKALKFRKTDEKPQVKISAEKIDNYWQFAVTDNGIGIEPAHHERIFNNFQRLHTRNEYSGSGIGLSHCKKIVELHKGRISVESIPGRGSCFFFTIRTTDNERQN